MPFGAGNFDEVVTPCYRRADFFQFAGKGGIALYGVPAQTGNAYRYGGKQPGGKEVGCAGRVAFDMDCFGGGVAGGGQPETPIAAVFHIDAESAHQVERDVDIGFGNQLALHLYFKCFAGQRQGHQQRGQELAGNVAFDGYAADAVVLPFADV